MRKLLLATVAVLGVAGAVAGVAHAQEISPGQTVVHLNGVLTWYAGVVGEGSQQFNNGLNNVANVGSLPSPSGPTKFQEHDFFGYIRLYPGFDAELANGIKYGVAAEIRDGIGAAGNSGTGLFFYRAGGYLGTDLLGTVWFGQTDGPISRFITGTAENWDTGGWNGDAPGIVTFNTPNFGIDWVPAENAPEVTQDKIVYLSPNFRGFDFGVSFAPEAASQGALASSFFGGDGNQDRLASVPGGADLPRNIVEAVGRYQGSYGDFGLVATAGYIRSTVIGNTTGPVAGGPIGFRGIQETDLGLEGTYGGFTVQGHLDVGHFANDMVPAAVGAHLAYAYELGASYGQGPWIVGVQYVRDELPLNFDTVTVSTNPTLNGKTVTSNMTENGISAGGTYNLTPGVAFYATYLYGQKRQANFDFGTGSDKVHVNAFVVGTNLHW